MLAYKINDLRVFFENDMDFLRQFENSRERMKISKNWIYIENFEYS